jgi:hypothetical protein
MLDKKYRIFKDTIQTQIDDRLVEFKNQLQTIEARIQ